MKKIITMVGTSIFDNYPGSSIDSLRESIKDREAGEWDNYQNILERIRQVVAKWAGEMSPEQQKRDVSAEIKSIIEAGKKQTEKQKESNISVYLLASDTLESALAAEINRNILGNLGVEAFFNRRNDVITNLQVKELSQFKEGLANLINRINQIAGGGSANSGYYGDCLINITGGYKATIPYLTILGQVNRTPIVYINKDSERLLEIPGVPLTLNEEIFEKYESLFESIESEGIIKNEDYHFQQEAESCLEIADGLVAFNSLGLILWRKYREKSFYFYASDQVWEEIQKQKNILEILKIKFWNRQLRDAKLKVKNGHTVYDAGDNPYRIFYFIVDNAQIYIYKTFDKDHDSDYTNYISEYQLNDAGRARIVSNSKLRGIRKETIKNV